MVKDKAMFRSRSVASSAFDAFCTWELGICTSALREFQRLLLKYMPMFAAGERVASSYV